MRSDGTALVSGYNARIGRASGAAGKNDRALPRIVAVDLRSGAHIGTANFPVKATRRAPGGARARHAVEHGGGGYSTFDPQGNIWLATTNYLYRIDPRRVFTTGKADLAVVGWVKLRDGLKGSFLDEGLPRGSLDRHLREEPGVVAPQLHLRPAATEEPCPGGRGRGSLAGGLAPGPQGGQRRTGSGIHRRTSPRLLVQLDLRGPRKGPLSRRGFGPGSEEIDPAKAGGPRLRGGPRGRLLVPLRGSPRRSSQGDGRGRSCGVGSAAAATCGGGLGT